MVASVKKIKKNKKKERDVGCQLQIWKGGWRGRIIGRVFNREKLSGDASIAQIIMVLTEH